jgi:hypothetical protein
MAYTEEEILGQIYVAFGQGTGTMRVSHSVCSALKGRYARFITDDVKNTLWETEGVQALERIRALGRLMAVKTSMSGKTVIQDDIFAASAQTIEEESLPPSLTSALCGGDPG